MINYDYTPHGVCSRAIHVSLTDDGSTIDHVSFEGGCNGNLKGICSLLRGQKAEDAIARMEGITCGGKSTSCPDQIAHALRAALEQQKNG